MIAPSAVRLVTREADPALVDYFANHRLFGVLPREALIMLAEQSRTRTYPRGHHLYTDGDPTTHVYVVRSGLIAMVELDDRGAPRVVITYSADDVSGSMCATLGMTHQCSATALLDSEVLHLSKHVFDSLYAQYPELSLRVLQEVHQIVRRSRRTIMRLTLTPIAARIASYLLNASELRREAPDGGRCTFELALSHQDLALLLGTSRESVTRVLDRLSREGTIAVSRRRVEILEPERLHRMIEA